MLTFITLFLGLIVGVHAVEVGGGEATARIELFLDGDRVGTATQPPWVIDCDFGEALLPHHLVAVARNAQGEETGRAEQWVNMPRGRAEAALVLEEFDDQVASYVRPVWSSVENTPPRRIEVRFDDQLLAPDGSGRYLLPAYDPRRLHLLTAELYFDHEPSTRVEAALGGRWGADLAVEMTAVPLQHLEGAPPSLASLESRVSKRGRPLSVVAVDAGRAEVVVVLEGGARLGLGVHGRLLDIEGGVAGRAFELRAGDRIRFLATTPRRDLERSVPFDLFPISPAFDRRHGTLPYLLTHVRLDGGGSQQLADAVAVAAIQAAAGNRPRAVVLIVGSRWRDSSRFEIEQAREFLAALRVPLVTWSTGQTPSRTTDEDRRPLVVRTPWGKARDISSISRFLEAVSQLRELLDSQTVVWVEGSHLPQEISLLGAKPPIEPARELSPEERDPRPATAVPIIAPPPPRLDAAASEERRAPAPRVSPAVSPTSLLAELNRLRGAADRPAYRLSEPLSSAAQRQADRLTAAPDLEAALLDARLEAAELDAAGFQARRWIQAVANSPDDAPGILAGWQELEPESWRLFLDGDLEELGIGLGRANGMPLYSFLAAESVADHYRRVGRELRDLGTVRQQVLDSVNAHRQAAGRPRLRPHPALDRAAQRYAERMRDEGFYGHRAPDGTTVLERVKAAGYRPRRAGENLANGPETSAQAVAGWMGSRQHRNNILSRRFTEMGLGVITAEADGEYKVLWVLCFGLPRP